VGPGNGLEAGISPVLIMVGTVLATGHVLALVGNNLGEGRSQHGAASHWAAPNAARKWRQGLIVSMDLPSFSRPLGVSSAYGRGVGGVGVANGRQNIASEVCGLWQPQPVLVHLRRAGVRACSLNVSG